MEPRPALRASIVIAAWNGEASLERCLASLAGQAGDAEVIVVANMHDEGAVARIRARFPFVRALPGYAGATVPVLRAAGIAAARGDVVLLAEDHCTFGEAWCSELVNAHGAGHAVVGGAVENASADRLSWAVYFFDYGRYMLPATAGPVSTLSGVNVSYRKTVLDQIAGSFRDGFWETFAHEALQARGFALYFVPSAVVYHQKRYRLGALIEQFFHMARAFAARRAARGSPVRRAGLAAGSVGLGVLLALRIAARTLGKRARARELLSCFPYVLLLAGTWSAGELCGYVTGEGASADRWR